MNFNKTLIALALSSTLAACGSDNKDTLDTTAPVITLSGSSNVSIALNGTYTDAGASATDNIDGSVQVTTSGTVDTAIAGDYIITFTATDAAGNTTSVTRTVTVVAPVETIVDGKGIKGVLTNAVVTVYKFINDEALALTDDELVNANIVTDDTGNYSFTVLDYDGPIKVELSPSTDPANPTTMTCDAPAGCGDKDFGQKIDLTAADPEFKLAAISVVTPESKGDVKVNVSALTHLASELIEASNEGITTESVSEESSKIANTFGISGNLTQLEPTVTDDAAAVAVEDNEEELRYGLINAGIMSALFSGEIDGSSVLSTKLATVAIDLVSNDGALLVNQDEDEDFELALADVLSGASDAAAAAAEAIKADDSIQGAEDILEDLAQEEVNLENEQAWQEANVGEDGLAEVITEEPTEGDAVTKAKAMVEDMRLFTHLFDEETDEGAGLVTQGDEYVALLDSASLMINTESESFTLLAQISEVLATLSMEYDAGTITPEMAAAGINIATLIQGATGSIAFDEETANGGISFNVDVTSGSEIVTLNAEVIFAEDELSLTLNINGSVESAGASFMVKDGSLAKIVLDTAISRDALENDTFEGEMVSGELILDIELAQKTTATITNPVTFTGLLSTELLPIDEHVLDEHWVWDENNQQDIVTYGRPQIETFVLPEMLTLSGEFSALEGDSISAVLTAGINNLAGYEAPEFKYIGKEVADVMNISFSDDLNTIVITEADKVSDEQQSTETRVYTPGGQTGEWTATSSDVAKNADEHYWGTGIERKIITTIDDQGVLQYTRAYITGEEENNFGIRSVRFIPVDSDQDGTVDAYNVQAISNSWDDKGYDGSNLTSLMDADGNVLTSDGELHPWDSQWEPGMYSSIEDFMTTHPWALIANPLTVSSGAELLAQTIDTWWGNQRTLTIDELGQATLFFDEEELADIAAGEFSELNPTAYLTKPIIKDALSITVSADSNTVTAVEIGAFTRAYNVSYTSPGNFVFNRSVQDITGFDYLDSRVYATENIGLNIDEVTILRTTDYTDELHYRFTRITPIDENGDGNADHLNASYLSSEYMNSDGVLTDETGEPLVEIPSYFSISYEDAYYHWNFPFNPFTITNGLEAYQVWLTNARGGVIHSYSDEIGSIETSLSEEELSSLTADSTTTFDGYNTQADSRNSLEDAEAYLGVNAALTLEALLGDYQVKLQLSGTRTALEQGAFDLDMSYRLPGEDSQRSFTIHHNTEEEGLVTANNADGVVLVLEEPVEEATGTQVIGQILVGPTAIVAATIEDRDGIIVIVYSDETTETL
ncbi:MAG: DUF5011 domain-containing protein [Litorilituus sp.]|jgi:hypothetical protein|nr:DUF5011 domain-containing protein [Litorilituus sp.]